MTFSEIIIIAAAIVLVVLVIKKLRAASFASSPSKVVSERTRKRFFNRAKILKLVVILGAILLSNYALSFIIPGDFLYSKEIIIVRAGMVLTGIALVIGEIVFMRILLASTTLVLIFSIVEYKDGKIGDGKKNNQRNKNNNGMVENRFRNYKYVVAHPAPMWSAPVNTVYGYRIWWGNLKGLPVRMQRIGVANIEYYTDSANKPGFNDTSSGGYNKAIFQSLDEIPDTIYYKYQKQ